MAWLLQPGDPVPSLQLARGEPSLGTYAGRYLLLALGPNLAHSLLGVAGDVAALAPAVRLLGIAPTLEGLPEGLPVVEDPGGATARRLGAVRPAEALVVLVDPAGRVVQAGAGEALPALLASALGVVAERMRR